MIIRDKEKAEAIKLRKKGYSYSEIKNKISVSKSSLSLWLRDLKLNNEVERILQNKLENAQKLGAEAKRRQRINREQGIITSAKKDIRKISKDELFLMGLMLYWAEGTKITENNVSQRVAFANSDPRMCRIFLMWLLDCLGVEISNVVLSVYIHDSYKDRYDDVIRFWSKEIGLPNDNFSGVYFTSTKLSEKNRRKDRKNYNGQLRMSLRKSVDLNRKIIGWIEGVCIQTGVVKPNTL